MSKRTVLVTGASTGIGRDAAIRLAREGVHVFAGVRREEDALGLRGEGLPDLEPVSIDVADADSIRRCADELAGRLESEGLHALVNNAGIVVSSTLEFVPLDAFRRQLEVNVTGQLAVTQALLPLIRRAKERDPARGRVVFTGSTSGYFAAPFVGPYNASKFAIEGLVDSLRRELRPFGIPVSLVQPGAIATPIWEKSEAAADELIDAMPEHGRALYGDAIRAVKQQVAQRSGSAAPVALVSKAIRHAVLSERPRPRYKVGADAWAQLALARLLPDRAADWLIGRVLG
ncbi:MAG: SDR family oxidoreductase [Myxococcota bacterium]|nr:SDR family oxidoreductase [Myxococcota bacterium]